MREAESQQKSTQDRVLRESQALAHAIEAEKPYRALEAVIAAFAARVRQVGLEADLPLLKDASERILARLELVPALRDFLDEIEATEETINHRVRETTQVANLQAQLSPSLVEALTTARTAFQRANARNAAAAESVTAATNRTRILQSEREALTRRIQQNSGRVQVLRNAWHTLAPDRAWTDNARAEVMAKLRAEFEAHQSAEQELAEADAFLRDQAVAQELESLHEEKAPLVAERDRLIRYREVALAIKEAYSDAHKNHVKQQMKEFVRVISVLFMRMQSNLVYDEVALGDDPAPLSWRALAENFSLNPEATFSQGQRQDFALSIFLARARGLGGTFVLDEPVAHLDDLNRVALLDVFRAITLERIPGLAFVMTTANKPLVRHLLEKFARISGSDAPTAAKLISLVSIEGNPRTGVRVVQDSNRGLEH